MIIIERHKDGIDNWHEINAETEATESNLKAQAYDILMGVTE